MGLQTILEIIWRLCQENDHSKAFSNSKTFYWNQMDLLLKIGGRPSADKIILWQFTVKNIFCPL
jgi:hypothetical protein